MNEWYFLDNPLRIPQGYDLGKIEAAGIDPHTGYRLRADTRLSEDTAAEVRTNRPSWRAHCLLVLPWHEIEPLGDGPERTLRFRRDVYAYEVPDYTRVEQVNALPEVTRYVPRTYRLGAKHEAYTLTLRPLRYVTEPRTLAGAAYKGTLYIVGVWK